MGIFLQKCNLITQPLFSFSLVCVILTRQTLFFFLHMMLPLSWPRTITTPHHHHSGLALSLLSWPCDVIITMVSWCHRGLAMLLPRNTITPRRYTAPQSHHLRQRCPLLPSPSWAASCNHGLHGLPRLLELPHAGSNNHPFRNQLTPLLEAAAIMLGRH